MAVTSGAGRRSRRPTTASRAPLSTSRGVSVCRWRANRRISAATSVGGRFQLSAEKANSVKAVTPWSGATSTTRRTASAPARWPAVRGRPRRAAQRPLPSMMTATWREGLCDIKLRLKKNSASAVPGGADQRLHMVQIALQRAATRGREPVLGLRDASLERLGAHDILGRFELPRVHAQVAVRRLQQPLEFLAAQRRVHRERADDAEAHTLVDQAVESGSAPPGGLGLEALLTRLRHTCDSALSQ